MPALPPLWGNSVLSLISRESLDNVTVFVKLESRYPSFVLHLGNNEMLMAWQKSYFNCE